MAEKSILETILDVAKAAAPFAGKGAPEAVVLASAVVDLIDRTKEIFTGSPASGPVIMQALSEQRDALERQVNEHVDRTTKALRGE